MANEKMCIFIKKTHEETETDGTIRTKILVTVNVSKFFKQILSTFRVGNRHDERVGYEKPNGQYFSRCKVKKLLLGNMGGAGQILFSKYDVKFTVKFTGLSQTEKFISEIKSDVARILKLYETVGQSTEITAVVVKNGDRGEPNDD